MADPSKIFNHDIVMVYDMCNRFIVELARSQSTPVSGMTGHDIVRMKSYTAALLSLHAWIIDQPLLDLPETHPREYLLEDAPEPVNAESESINMLTRLIEALRTEMINSASARYASTMIVHDSGRYVSIIGKIDKFIVDYIEKATPLDLPESSPSAAMTAPGLGGV